MSPAVADGGVEHIEPVGHAGLDVEEHGALADVRLDLLGHILAHGLE